MRKTSEPIRSRMARGLLSGGRRRHGLFLVAAIAGIAAGLVAAPFVPTLAAVIGAITLFVVYLALVALVLPAMSSAFLRARAAEADTPVVFIFGVVVAVVVACCATLFMALNRQGAAGLEVGLSVVSVLLGWFTIHTMAALHYAYEYYEPVDGRPAAGLDFQHDDAPDAIEFLYFAYVIGVAFAVSDVQVRSRKMRSIVLVHSTFAYFFNTIILAATVNVAVAVGS